MTSFDQFLQVWTNLDKFDPFVTSLNKFGQVWTNFDKFEQFWTSLNKFEQNFGGLPVLWIGCRSSCLSFSLSLKHPKEFMARRTSSSMNSSVGMMWVCTTSIMGASSSSSPLLPAVTQGCRLTSCSCWKIQKISINDCSF